MFVSWHTIKLTLLCPLWFSVLPPCICGICALHQHGVQTGGGGKQCTTHEKQPYHLVMRKTELGNTLCL